MKKMAKAFCFTLSLAMLVNMASFESLAENIDDQQEKTENVNNEEAGADMKKDIPEEVSEQPDDSLKEDSKSSDHTDISEPVSGTADEPEAEQPEAEQTEAEQPVKEPLLPSYAMAAEELDENDFAYVYDAATGGYFVTHCYNSNPGELSIPTSYKGLPVTGIGQRNVSDDFFKSSEDEVTQVVLPKSITYIGGETFQGCCKLRSIEIKGQVTEIGEFAFYGCKELSEITLPSSVQTIGDYIFSNCNGLQTVNLSSSLKKIGNRAFNKCTSLKKISLPSSLESIGEYAFGSCESLTEIRIPASVKTIGSNPFFECTSLKKAYIATSHMGSKLFSSWDAVQEVEISAEKVSEEAFMDCESLKKVTLTSAVKKIDARAFSYCGSLESIVIPSSLTKIGKEAFHMCTSLKKIKLPSSVKDLGESAFSGCSSLESVTLPSSLKKIYIGTFMDCTSLRKISIPASVKKIEGQAFDSCTSLSQVVMTKNVKNIAMRAFYRCNLGILTIVAPKDSYAANFANEYTITTTTSKKFSIDMGCSTLFVGQWMRPVICNSPSDVRWSSSNKSVIEVLGDGKYKIKKAGSVKITAKIGSKKYSKKYKVIKRTKKNVLNMIYNHYVTKDMTDYEKVIAANRWLALNVKYNEVMRKYGGIPLIKGENKNTFSMNVFSDVGVFQDGDAVCGGYSEAFKVIMDHYGIPCKYVSGKAGVGNHAWNLVKIGSKWYQVDTTWSDLTMDNDNWISSDYILKTDRVFKKDHTWKKSDYPKANATKIDKNITHTGISGAVISRRTATLKKGKTVTFKVSGTKKKVSFKSSNKKVAAVNNKGKVTAKKKGTAKIKIKIGSKTYTCTVTVK